MTSSEHSAHNTNPSEFDSRRMFRGAQLAYMGAITAVSLLIVCFFDYFAYKRHNPPSFWGIELFVIVLTWFVAGWDQIEGYAQTRIGRYESPKPSWATRLVEQRREGRLGAMILVVGLVGNMVALWQLVDHTGGSLHSPFAPLLAAPAIFGAYVAQGKRGLLQLIVISSVVLGFVYAWYPGKELPRAHGAWPSWITHAGAAISLLVSAGLIAALQMVRQPERIDDRVLMLVPEKNEAEIRELVEEAVRHARQLLREKRLSPAVGVMTLQRLITDAAVKEMSASDDDGLEGANP